MPKLTDPDIGSYSTSSESVPADTYRATLFEVEDTKTSSGLPQWIYKSRIKHGDTTGDQHKDREIWDFVVLDTKDHQPNKVGRGRVRAYTEAILGEEAGANPNVDTDELLNSDVTLVVKPHTYEKDGEQKKGTKVAKVLPAS